ncbi:MAG: long-chain fatty acid--CoA ligase, partial [Chloroflexi bacterium]
GGTTGVPKGAMLTHKNMLANAIQVRHWLVDAKEGGEVMLSVLPFFHVYGMTVCMNMAIYIGSAMVLLPQFKVKEVLEAINKYKPTLFPGVATMYVAINTYPEVSKYDISSIRACIAGAMPLPYEVWTKFEEITGGKLVEGYGLTEASPVTHCNPIYGLRKPCIGLPFPDTEAKIVDLETGEKELPIGEIGELAVRGPQVMKGYWNMPEETKMVLKPDGWLLTGDIAKMDEDGYFYIVDRKKDMILSGGYNIYPREIEEVLYAHPKVKEVAAVGVPDEYKGEVPKVFIVLKEGETATEEEIIAYCKENLAKYKIPKYVEFRKELPKTMVGKILRRVLAEEEKKKMAKAG